MKTTKRMVQTAIWMPEDMRTELAKHPGGLGAGVREAAARGMKTRPMKCGCCGAPDVAWTKQPHDQLYAD